MYYITIIESENNCVTDAPNIGTLCIKSLDSEKVNDKFKDAIEAYFDAPLVSYSYMDEDVNQITDCLSATPIDVKVMIEGFGGENHPFLVTLSQTWLY